MPVVLRLASGRHRLRGARRREARRRVDRAEGQLSDGAEAERTSASSRPGGPQEKLLEASSFVATVPIQRHRLRVGGRGAAVEVPRRARCRVPAATAPAGHGCPSAAGARLGLAHGCPAPTWRIQRCLQQEPSEPEVYRRDVREELGLCRGYDAWGGSWPARTRVWRSSDAAAAEARGMGLGRVRCGRGRGGARMRPWVRAAVSPRPPSTRRPWVLGARGSPWPPSTRRPRPHCAVRVLREEGGEVGGEQAGLRRRHGGRMLWWRWLMPKPNTGHVGGSGTTVRMKFAIFPFSETGFAKIPLNF